MTVTLETWHFASSGQSCRTSELATTCIDATAWSADDARLLSFDRQVHLLEDTVGQAFSIELAGDDWSIARTASQFPLRYQRLFALRNAQSSGEHFDRLLAAHAALHDRTKPLVRADHDHALDVWQWTLKLAPAASEALQIAALFHDIERLASEADVRIEQHASDYLAFKQGHAKRGARMLAELLERLDVPEPTRGRVCELVERHEQPTDDEELRVLNDADALSWFSLNSPGFLSYFGADHTRKKLRFTLDRISSARAREFLATVRLQRELATMLQAETQPLGNHERASTARPLDPSAASRARDASATDQP